MKELTTTQKIVLADAYHAGERGLKSRRCGDPFFAGLVGRGYLKRTIYAIGVTVYHITDAGRGAHERAQMEEEKALDEMSPAECILLTSGALFLVGALYVFLRFF